MSLSLPNVIAFYRTRYVHAGATAAVSPPFRHGKTALCGSHPLVTPYYCRLGDLLCFVFICLIIVFLCYLCTIPLVLWYCWLTLLTCKNRLPYLYVVGGDVKHCSIQYRTRAVIGYAYVIFPITYVVRTVLVRYFLVEWKRKSEQQSHQQLKIRNISESSGPNVEKLSAPHVGSPDKPFVSKINSGTSLRKVWNVTGK